MAAAKNSKNSIRNCFLPEEMVMKILTLLPVISLLRCKLVCKTWLSIISNPQFIQTHLVKSQEKQPSSLLKVVDKSIYVDTWETSTLLHVLAYFDGEIDSVCSCNGLVCLANLLGDFICLFNPMTKLFKKLPIPTQQLDCEEFLFGFGFDDISNDYKILRIAVYLFVDENDGDVVCSLQVELYSAKNDSWKEIEVPETCLYFDISRNMWCVNPQESRVLYIEGTSDLLSFDLHTEEFRVYPYPISAGQSDEQRMSVVLDFEGSVAMIFNEDGSVSTLWRLDDVSGNWTKVYNLEYSLNNNQVTSLYLGDGQFFGHDGEYIFYDYKNKYGKKLLPAPSPTRTASIVKYNESLVSLKGFQLLK